MCAPAGKTKSASPSTSGRTAPAPGCSRARRRALRLKHDHRHEDGSEDKVTQYGGDTAEAGTAEKQEFPADAFTAQLIPAAKTNIWTMRVVPGRTFTYALRREAEGRRFTVEFDLSRPVAPPPAPWGQEGK